MRYFNEDKTIEIQEKDIDYSKGTVVEDILITHHKEQPEILEVPEKGHYKTIKEYPNGGKDVEWVVDVPKTPGRAKIDAYDEEEKIFVYKPYSEEFLKERETAQQINRLKGLLSETDYKVLKYIEGYYTEEEYALIRTERENLREQIRKLENK